MRRRIPYGVYKHSGKILGVLLGLLLGLRLFGVIFGCIAGALADILLQDIWLKRRLRQPGSIRSIREHYSPQLQGIVKMTWLLLHTARFSSPTGSCDRHDARFLQEMVLSSFPLSARGKAIVKQIFHTANESGTEHPVLEALMDLPNPELNALDQIAAAQLLYRTASVCSGSEMHPAKISAFITEMCVLLNIDTRYRTLAAEISSTTDNSNYELLGVRRDSSVREIKRVYRTIAAQFHPDSLHGLSADQKEEATEAFVRIRTAYEQIMSQHEKQ